MWIVAFYSFTGRVPPASYKLEWPKSVRKTSKPRSVRVTSSVRKPKTMNVECALKCICEWIVNWLWIDCRVLFSGYLNVQRFMLCIYCHAFIVQLFSECSTIGLWVCSVIGQWLVSDWSVLGQWVIVIGERLVSDWLGVVHKWLFGDCSVIVQCCSVLSSDISG